MRFASHVLLLQLATVSAVVAVSAGVFTVLGVQQLQREAESSALAIARTVAEDVEVRASVAQFSEDPGTPTHAAAAAGPLQPLAEAVRTRTGALFVVITDDHGIRLAHPDENRLGERVSTSFEDAVAGRETVSWETGTLGESARAKVPVYAPSGGSGAPVGEVSVGFARASVFTELPGLLGGIAVTAVVALAIGVVASVLIRRRLTRLTIGLQPEELAVLVQDQAAVLDGVGEGVLALTPGGEVSVCNERAARMLALTHPVGSPVQELGLPAPLARLLADAGGATGEAAQDVFVADGRVVYVDVRRVERDGHDLGTVAVLRDRTDLDALARRLDAVATMTNALRAQRHEFANRLHVVAGLIDADRVPDARSYLADVVARGPLKFPVEHADRIQEPYLQALLGAKGIEAAERGVLLTLGAETLVTGAVAEPEDVATVLGNLIDNAISAAVDGEEPRWVEVELLDDGADLFLTVADSGAGVADPSALFERGDDRERAGADAVHGHGFGLPLCRDIARRRGGDVWLVDAGGDAGGAVLCARLPGTMHPEPVGTATEEGRP